MADNLLIRAKKTSDRKWVEGYGFRHNGRLYILDLIYIDGQKVTFEVDESTICRCSGKEYMDGETAYENDIFMNPDGLIFVMKYGTYEAYCPADKCYMQNIGFYAEAAGYPQMPIGDIADYALKIGNVFDNPEFLNE